MTLVLSTRLRELRQAKNLYQEQLARIIGVHKNTISAYENDIRQPSYDVLIRFAHYFNVSTDYLLGLTSDKTVDVSGLTEVEASLIRELIKTMSEKNEKLRY